MKYYAALGLSAVRFTAYRWSLPLFNFNLKELFKENMSEGMILGKLGLRVIIFAFAPVLTNETN